MDTTFEHVQGDSQEQFHSIIMINVHIFIPDPLEAPARGLERTSGTPLSEELLKKHIQH